MSGRRLRFLKEICKAKGKPFTKQVLRDWKKIPVDQKEFISKGWAAVKINHLVKHHNGKVITS